MNRHAKRPGTALVALVVIALVTTACSTKARDAGGDAATPGVTKDTITLGILTDLTGVFAAGGTGITNAQKLYWQGVNEDGGLCGRQVELVVKDHGYDVQKAVTLYNQMEDDVLALQQSLGSPTTTALLPSFASDDMLAVPGAWSSTLLAEPTIMIVGTTYDYEMINGIDYMIDDGMLEPGDTVGHIYFEGEYGEDALLGSEYAARQRNLELIPQKIKATDVDVSAQVTTLKNRGADAILLTAGPKQSASAASAAATLEYDVPIVANNPGWSPGLLDTSAAKPLQEHLYLVSSWLGPAAKGNERLSELLRQYREAYPDAPLWGSVTWGFGSAAAFHQVLRKACEGGGLSRESVLKAFRSMTGVDTEGIFPPLDYSKQGAAPTEQSYISRPDADVTGGLRRITEDTYKGETVASYTPPALQNK